MEDRSSAPDCARGNDLIAFLYGEVSETEAQDFQRHLRTCAECQSELGSFKQVRQSIIAWREETLGIPNALAVPTVANMGRLEPKRRSALAAIREFLSLSPLWLKGAAAFASILFCVAAVLAVAGLWGRSQAPVATHNDQLYTREEMSRKVEEAVQSKVRELEAQQKYVLGDQAVAEHKVRLQKRISNPRPSAPAKSAVLDLKSQISKRRPLTKSESEQLAADLRLISARDETDLDLLGDRFNQPQ